VIFFSAWGFISYSYPITGLDRPWGLQQVEAPRIYIQGGSNMTGTDLCVNKPHSAAAVRPWENEATTSTLPSLFCRNRILAGQFRWPAVRLLVLRVQIPPGEWASVCCECCVLSGKGHCVGLITRPEVAYPVWCVWVWLWSLEVPGPVGALAPWGGGG